MRRETPVRSSHRVSTCWPCKQPDSARMCAKKSRPRKCCFSWVKTGEQVCWGEIRMKGWWQILGGKKDARQGGRKRLHWMSRINNPNLPEAAPPRPLLHTDHGLRNFDFFGGCFDAQWEKEPAPTSLDVAYEILVSEPTLQMILNQNLCEILLSTFSTLMA